MSDSDIPDRCVTALPSVERGYGMHIYSNAAAESLIYAVRNSVVIRSLNNPSVGSTFDGHKCKVNVAKFSPNGEWVASGDERGRVLVWGRTTRIVKNEVQVNRCVLDLDWSEDGKRIVAVGDGAEKQAKVFAWDAGNNIGEVIGHTKKIISVAFKPSRPYRLVTTSEDNLVAFHEGPPFKFHHTVTKHTKYPNDVAYSPDGSVFVTVGADFKVLLYDGTSGEITKEVGDAKEAHKGSVYAVAFNDDGSQFATASADKTVKTWSVATGQLVQTYTLGKEVGDFQVGVTWCGAHLVSVSLSGFLNFLDPANPNQPRHVVYGHSKPPTALSVSANGSQLATCDSNGVACVWDAVSGHGRVLRGKGHGGVLNGCALSGDGDVVYTVGTDDKVRRNECKSMDFSVPNTACGGFPSFVAASSRDSSLACVGVAQGKVLLLRNNQVVDTVNVGFKTSAAAFAPNDDELAVTGEDKKVHVYAIMGGNKLSEKKVLVHDAPTTSVAYSNDGRLLAASDKEGITFVYNRQADYALTNKFGFKYHTAGVRCCAFSPNSARLATVSLDGSLIVWLDMQNMNESDRKKWNIAHDGGATFCAWVSDDTVVTVGDDIALKYWKL